MAWAITRINLQAWIHHGIKIDATFIGDTVSFRARKHDSPFDATLRSCLLHLVQQQRRKSIVTCNGFTIHYQRTHIKRFAELTK
jgi:hypothetical protein